MFIDALLLLSDAQALTATAFSTNTIDLSNVTPKRDIAVGETMAIVLTVDVAADFTTGDETYTFQFVQSANANLSSPDVLAQWAILASALTIGASFVFPLPENRITKQFIGMQYTLAGTTPTITVTCFLTSELLASVGTPKAYAKGYTIS